MSVDWAPDGAKCGQHDANSRCRWQAVVVADRFPRWDHGWSVRPDLVLITHRTPLCVAHAELVPEAKAFLDAKAGA